MNLLLHAALATLSVAAACPPDAAEPPLPLSLTDRSYRFAVADSPLTPVSDDALAGKPALRKYLKSVAAHSDGMVIYTVERPVYAVTSATLEKMFPGWDFYVVPYGMKQHPDYEGPVCLAFGLYNVVAIDASGKSAEFFGYGNYEPFGEFLAVSGIQLRTAEDARRIATAFAHAHRRGSSRREPRRVSPTLWHLSPEVVGDTEYFYEVRTNEDGAVVSAKLRTRPVPAQGS